MTISEIRCPACGKLLVKQFEGQAELYCESCHLEVMVKQRRRSLFPPLTESVISGISQIVK